MTIKQLLFNFKFFWRKIRNKCVICGGPMQNHKNCIHCNYFTLLNGCHWCGKRRNFAKAYGMSGANMKKVLSDPTI